MASLDREMSNSSSFVDLHASLALRLACRFQGFDANFLDRFVDDLCWSELSGNSNVEWTDELVLRHVERWRPVELLRNPGITWTSSLIAAYGRRADWYYLSQNPNLPIDEAFLQRHHKEVVWSFLAKNQHVTPQLERKYPELREDRFDLPPATTLADLFTPDEAPEGLDLARSASSLTPAEARAHWDALQWLRLFEIKLSDWGEEWLDLLFEKHREIFNSAGAKALRYLFEGRFAALMNPDVSSWLAERFEASPFVFVKPQTHDEYGLIPGLDRADELDELFSLPLGRRPETVELTVSPYKEGPVRALGAVEARTFRPTLTLRREARAIVERFHLPGHFWLDVRVRDKKWPGNHAMLCLETELLDNVDYSTLPASHVLSETGWRTGPAIGARSELQDLERAHAPHRDMLDFFPAARLAQHPQLEPYDAIGHEDEVLMSRRLLRALREAGITGLLGRSAIELKVEWPREPEPVELGARRLQPVPTQADPRSPTYRYFEAKMERLQHAQKGAVPASYAFPKDALGRAERRLQRVFPTSFRKFYAEQSRRRLAGGYRILPTSKLYLIGEEGYELSYPEVWGGVVFAEDGCGDALALLLTKRSDWKLGATVWELQHEAGVIERRTLGSLLRSAR